MHLIGRHRDDLTTEAACGVIVPLGLWTWNTAHVDCERCRESAVFASMLPRSSG